MQLFKKNHYYHELIKILRFIIHIMLKKDKLFEIVICILNTLRKKRDSFQKTILYASFM